MTVSVVIPVFNRAQTVRAALDSVAAQTQLPAEIIIVDDGSTDNTAASVMTWKEDAPVPVQLLQQDNRGVSAARNRGLFASMDTPYIAFLDSDDRWPPDFLLRTVSTLAADSAAAAVTCDMLQCRVEEEILVDTPSLAQDPIQWMLIHGAGISSASLFSKNAVTALGGFDETLRSGEDAALYLTLAARHRWKHAEGSPVLMGRGRYHAPGEQPNLSTTRSCALAEWATIYERVLVKEGVFDTYKKELARLWFRAGKELGEAKRKKEALSCYRRALRFASTYHRVWSKLFWAAFGR